MRQDSPYGHHASKTVTLETSAVARRPTGFRNADVPCNVAAMEATEIQTLAYLITAVLLIAMPLAMEVGRRVRLARLRNHPDADDHGTGPLDAAVYALFGLLLAFIFSGAAGRFDERRELIAAETNAIGTAYLRVDLLPETTQAILRPLFREYVDSRLAMHNLIGDPDAAWAEHLNKIELQNRIWRIAIEGAKATGSPAVLSLITPALNEMIDITTTRLAAIRTHPPTIVYAMLVIVAVASSFLSGMAMARSPTRPWPHILAFTLVICATTYVILDIEVPRLGFIRVDAADALLIELRDSMPAPAATSVAPAAADTGE
jgi:hypothetical protein